MGTRVRSGRVRGVFWNDESGRGRKTKDLVLLILLFRTWRHFDPATHPNPIPLFLKINARNSIHLGWFHKYHWVDIVHTKWDSYWLKCHMVKFVIDFLKTWLKNRILLATCTLKKFNPEKKRFSQTKSPKLALSMSRTAPCKICRWPKIKGWLKIFLWLSH